MDREQKAKNYFKNQISWLVDYVYSPIREVSDEYLLSRLEWLKGALCYALVMEDIDDADMRIYSDEINRVIIALKI